jgi:RNA polymerase sigma-70 factor (ECF subfamily)
MTEVPPDEALVRRARGGDREAFDALIRRSQPHLARLVRARMGGELRAIEDSDDLVQTTLAAAVRDLPAFTPDGAGSFLRWLGSVVENKIRHHLRHLRQQCRDPARGQAASTGALAQLAGSGTSPSADAAERETETRYRAALEQLEPIDREVVLLHVELGWTYQDIADALEQKSSEAVRKRVTRAVARLGLLMGRA